MTNPFKPKSEKALQELVCRTYWYAAETNNLICQRNRKSGEMAHA